MYLGLRFLLKLSLSEKEILMKEKTFTRVLWVFTAINVLYLLATIFISEAAMGDDLEHIHASWLVWQGQTPYTDFFEHHHPLMWYLFAPLAGFFEGKIFIFFAARFCMCLAGLVTLWIVYRLIKDFWGDKIAALLAVCLFCFSTVARDALVQFKPDALMHLFFFGGLYFFFAFLRDDRQKQLNTAVGLWGVSFLFLQTEIFLLLPVGLCGIYLLAVKKIKFQNVLKALPWALLPLLLLAVWLLLCGNAQRYFETNWLLNADILNEIWNRRIHDYSDFYGFFAVGAAAAIYLLISKPDIYVRILLVMYVVELLLRTTYISIWIYYFKILLLYNAVLVGLVVSRFYRKKEQTAWICLPFLILLCGKFWMFESASTGATDMNTLQVMQVATVIAQNSAPDDVVVSPSGIPMGIFNKNPHYYWFSWQYMGRLDEARFHYAEPFDIMKIITETKPKFVYWDEWKKEKQEERLPYKIQPEIMKVLYHPVVYDTLFLRND